MPLTHIWERFIARYLQLRDISSPSPGFHVSLVWIDSFISEWLHKAKNHGALQSPHS